MCLTLSKIIAQTFSPVIAAHVAHVSKGGIQQMPFYGFMLEVENKLLVGEFFMEFCTEMRKILAFTRCRPGPKEDLDSSICACH